MFADALPERLDPAAASNDELAAGITCLSAHIYAAEARLPALIREFDERGAWGGVGIMSIAHWLNWRCGMSMGTARERVRVAHALARLPRIACVGRR